MSRTRRRVPFTTFGLHINPVEFDVGPDIVLVLAMLEKH